MAVSNIAGNAEEGNYLVINREQISAHHGCKTAVDLADSKYDTINNYNYIRNQGAIPIIDYNPRDEILGEIPVLLLIFPLAWRRLPSIWWVFSFEFWGVVPSLYGQQCRLCDHIKDCGLINSDYSFRKMFMMGVSIKLLKMWCVIIPKDYAVLSVLEMIAITLCANISETLSPQ